jgi:hypothetical protein
MQFSNNGKFLAYCDSERYYRFLLAFTLSIFRTVCINTFNGEELFSHPFARPTRIMFSPDDRLLITYEPYVIYGSRTDEEGNQRVPDPNLRFIDTTSGELLATLIQRNQTFWEPQFTADGQSFVLVENSELHFFESSTPGLFCIYFGICCLFRSLHSQKCHSWNSELVCQSRKGADYCRFCSFKQ